MKARVLHAWEVVRTSFWFVPLLCAVAATVLAGAMLRVDQAVDPDFVGDFGWLYSRGKEGSRELLGVVAGSMITVAGLAFSVIVVALQVATTQFGPRLLRTFMRDVGNQIVLGTFVGTFIYCLLIMRTIGDSDAEPPPHLSVTVGVSLAMLSMGVLIYFIHHAAASMQAPNVIAAVARDLRAGLDKAFPARVEDPYSLEPVAGPPPEVRHVPAARAGYVQRVDYDALSRYAARHDAVIQLLRRPGQFVVEGAAVAIAWPRESVPDQIDQVVARAIVMGQQRTPEQDPEFAVHQLTEIALRALSPSLNDAFTALTCIDQLTGAIGRVLARGGSPVTSALVEGRPRVILAPVTLDGLLDAAFHPIRQASAGSAMVTIRLLEALGTLGIQAATDEARAAVRRHLELAGKRIQEIPDDNGRADALARYDAALTPVSRRVESSLHRG